MIHTPNISAEEEEWIEITGAREHNLQNISLRVPRNKMVVITGLSGSGKSSLAFDTIYAEGQRRYMETFSAYARQFMGTMDRPDVDKIEGLSPVISIEQKLPLGIQDQRWVLLQKFMTFKIIIREGWRSLFLCYRRKMVRYTEEQIIDHVFSFFSGKTAILAPVIRARKGHYRELFEQTRKKVLPKSG